jgi:hypothetical protein
MPWLLLLCTHVVALVMFFGVLVSFLCAVCKKKREKLRTAQETKTPKNIHQIHSTFAQQK